MSRSIFVESSVPTKRVNQSDDCLSLRNIHRTERLNKGDFCSVLSEAAARIHIRNRLTSRSEVINRNVIQISECTKDFE